MHTTIPLLLTIAFGTVLYFLLRNASSYSDDDRRRDLAVLARKLQLGFRPGGDFALAKQYLFLHWLNRGDNQCLYNIFHGQHTGQPVTLFDFTFTAGKATYYWSAYVLEIGGNFPDLLISPESRESRIAEALGLEHILFESAEFSRVFRVRSADRKFAFAFCHPRMMEFLLANQEMIVEIRGNSLAGIFEDWLRPEKVEGNLSRLMELRKLMPEMLFSKN